MLEKLKTISQDVSGEITQKKSKFIANVFYIETAEEAEDKIKELKKKYHDARHNCYAYIVLNKENNVIEKCSDDGEPSGTAGAPILTILKGMELCNVLVVVTRYFGGILLGTGGLVRAYSDATTIALGKASFKIREKGKKVRILVSYQDAKPLKYYARKNGINILKEEYSENVEFFIEITNQEYEKLEKQIDNLLLKVIKLDKMEEKYI